MGSGNVHLSPFASTARQPPLEDAKRARRGQKRNSATAQTHTDIYRGDKLKQANRTRTAHALRRCGISFLSPLSMTNLAFRM